ncbi:MAG: hypothetical protein ABSE84_33975 [Isosphaeraceae bacterium]
MIAAELFQLIALLVTLNPFRHSRQPELVCQPDPRQRLEEEFGFSVHHAVRPLTCVAEGAALVVSMPSVIAAYSGN